STTGRAPEVEAGRAAYRGPTAPFRPTSPRIGATAPVEAGPCPGSGGTGFSQDTSSVTRSSAVAWPLLGSHRIGRSVTWRTRSTPAAEVTALQSGGCDAPAPLGLYSGRSKYEAISAALTDRHTAR